MKNNIEKVELILRRLCFPQTTKGYASSSYSFVGEGDIDVYFDRARERNQYIWVRRERKDKEQSWEIGADIMDGVWSSYIKSYGMKTNAIIDDVYQLLFKILRAFNRATINALPRIQADAEEENDNRTIEKLAEEVAKNV